MFLFHISLEVLVMVKRRIALGVWCKTPYKFSELE